MCVECVASLMTHHHISTGAAVDPHVRLHIQSTLHLHCSLISLKITEDISAGHISGEHDENKASIRAQPCSLQLQL